MKNFGANSVFQGKRWLFKILNEKKYIFNTVNSGHTLFFRTSTSCSKILNIKTIFNAVKIFRANSVFQGKRKLFKILKDKKYIQYSEFRAQSVFQGKQNLLKHPECKMYIKYSANFMTNFVFRASASYSKILKDKNISKQWKISGQTLFFRACASCSKFWMIKNIYTQ